VFLQSDKAALAQVQRSCSQHNTFPPKNARNFRTMVSDIHYLPPASGLRQRCRADHNQVRSSMGALNRIWSDEPEHLRIRRAGWLSGQKGESVLPGFAAFCAADSYAVRAVSLAQAASEVLRKRDTRALKAPVGSRSLRSHLANVPWSTANCPTNSFCVIPRAVRH
jgi:hypothetical protein